MHQIANNKDDEMERRLEDEMECSCKAKKQSHHAFSLQDAVSWEDKLNRISAMFDVWIDVQRRWVYLEGLFSGSADIATLLPMESARFSRFVSSR